MEAHGTSGASRYLGTEVEDILFTIYLYLLEVFYLCIFRIS